MVSDAEWKPIEPLTPRGQRGAHRVDHRRVISGIMHMLRSGARWRDCPAEYGLYTMIYNRFNRWSRQDVWSDIFYALTDSTARVGTISIDSTHIKAHRSAAGAKGGLPAGGRPVARRAHHKNPRADRGSRPAGSVLDHAKQLPLPTGGTRSAANSSAAPTIAGRHSLRRQQPAELVGGAWRQGRHTAQSNPQAPHRYDVKTYNGRNLIERMFCRLKDLRRIATRYDKRADVYLSAILWRPHSLRGSIEPGPQTKLD
jgi:transposase